ncbi:MAG TPA: type II secretion system ATPase GspE [Polyangiaceae bacterium]|nr:type II secretion system ATPase GspE [Polyangiaceae bacterium]
MHESYLGEILVRRGVVTEERLKPFVAQQRERDKGPSLIDMLLAGNVADASAVGQALAAECGLPYVQRIDIDAIITPVASKLPISYAKSHRILVTAEDDSRVYVVCADPLDTAGLDDVRALFQKPVEAAVSSAENLVDAINRVYERNDQGGGDLETNDDIRAEEELEDILDSDDDAPIIRWVNALFFQGVKERASDIHIEPEEKEVLVRYRIDGELYVAKRANKQFMSSIIARVKIMAGLNIAEKRLPQDGRISLKIAGKSIDVRVSTIPTSRGFERIVMRLLHKTNVLLDLPDLGFAARDYALMDGLIRKPDGIILVTGPTGSGKTTTLYAALNRINHPNLNILTAEDPVEYEIGGIHQVHVQPKIGLSFASALRAFLRQDPDVIMVGEIRDKETAEIAIHASLTGHLVLSTIHTNDAAGAVTRLVEMEIEPFLVRSSVIGILAQRLVRLLCSSCREAYSPSDFELRQLGLDADRIAWRRSRKMSPRYLTHGTDYVPAGHDIGSSPVFYRAKGCDACLQTGYTGRRGIYELLMIDDSVGGLILKNADAQSIKRAAVEQGMDTLRDDGARKVLMGMTTVEEVLAATQEDVAVE